MFYFNYITYGIYGLSPPCTKHLISDEFLCVQTDRSWRHMYGRKCHLSDVIDSRNHGDDSCCYYFRISRFFPLGDEIIPFDSKVDNY